MLAAKFLTTWTRLLAGAALIATPGCHWLRGDDPVCRDVCCDECKRLPPVHPCWDTSFYGYAPTCWRRFPLGWTPCPAPDWTEPSPAPQMVLPAPLESIGPGSGEPLKPARPAIRDLPAPPPVPTPSDSPPPSDVPSSNDSPSLKLEPTSSLGPASDLEAISSADETAGAEPTAASETAASETATAKPEPTTSVELRTVVPTALVTEPTPSAPLVLRVESKLVAPPAPSVGQPAALDAGPAIPHAEVRRPSSISVRSPSRRPSRPMLTPLRVTSNLSD